MSMNSVAQVKAQEVSEYLGTERNGMYRPTITLENLDTTKVDKSNIDNDGYCDFLRIPLTPQADEILSYQQMFCYLVDKVVCGFNDVFPQSENLFLVVDDSEGERQYYIGADVQVEDWDGINTRVSIEEIHPSDEEIVAIVSTLKQLLNNGGTKMKRSETLRPLLTLESFDTTKVDKSNIIDDFCNNVSIPLKITGEEKSAFEQVFNNLVFKYVERNGRDDTINPQPISLDLVVDDNSGNRKYYIGTEIQREDWDGNEPIYMSEEVDLTDDEKAAIELALLKVTNPEEYLRRYTRYQVALLPQIKDKMGFVIDGIRNDDLYASVWLSQDQKTCMLACVEHCHNLESKIQLLKIGQ